MIVRAMYRIGLIAFFLGGALGSMTGGGTTGDPSPAIVVASNAIVNGFELGAVGVVVGLIVGPVHTSRRKLRRYRHQCPCDAREGDGRRSLTHTHRRGPTNLSHVIR
jgi:hypothetical protein